jgi:DNA-directed RNA polymerase subunit RPC12/RpoP
LYRKKKDDAPQQVFNKPTPPAGFKATHETRVPQKSAEAAEARTQYLCGRCKYKFWKVSRIPASKCPNCDRTEIFVLKSEKAADVLSDDFLKGHGGIDF